MSGQPTVVASRRRQHELLRSWSTWAMTSILLDPTEVARMRESGWAGTHHHDKATGLRIVGTADGVGLGFGVGDSWHNPTEVIRWSEIEAMAHEVPDEVREQITDFRTRWSAHQRAYPRFTASAAAVGCGPIIPDEPLTPRQEAHVRELDAFDASGVLPAWEKKYAALDDERLELHERALAAVLDQAPDDLLDLLEDQHLSQPAATASVEPARQTRALSRQRRAAAVARRNPCGSATTPTISVRRWRTCACPSSSPSSASGRQPVPRSASCSSTSRATAPIR